MYNFITLPLKEQQQMLTIAAEKTPISEHVLEKDFWVCLILDQLFKIRPISAHLTFKGGTSLSKVYNVIKRFSEDVDISIDKSFLGFTQERDPECQTSNKKTRVLIDELSNACSTFVRQNLIQELKKS